MICLYHNDNDGKCAAHLVNKYYDAAPDEVVRFVEVDYVKKFPLSLIYDDEIVYIVDYSIRPDIMNRLLEITNRVHWIDHHITSIEKYNDYPVDIPGLRNPNISGCELTYLYLNNLTVNDENLGNIPYYIRLVGDYDTWKFKYGEDTRAFHCGLQAYELDPRNSYFDKIAKLAELVNSVISAGNIVSRYLANYSRSLCTSYGFESTICGHVCYALNVGNLNSDAMASVGHIYGVLVSFVYDGNSRMWKYSVYTQQGTGVASEIAKAFGGGGHGDAAGFSLPYLILGPNTGDC